jgi:spore coat polysaccharide biosynthesis protein SpsF
LTAVAIIQARAGSTRLPGKVLRLLAGRTVLSHVVERVKAVAGVDRVVVATTTQSCDDELTQEALHSGAQVFRGSEQDVLSRYFSSASEAGADTVIRVTSDCPLLDPYVVSDMLDRFLKAAASGNGFDYMSNGLRRTFPRGLDAEVFTMDALGVAHRSAKQSYEREHVTPYIYQHPEQFSINSFEAEADLSHYRWTLDTEDDFAMLTRVFDALSRPPSLLTTAEVLDFLRRHPEVAQINSGVQQKALGE